MKKFILNSIPPSVSILSFYFLITPPNIFNLIPANIHRTLFRNFFSEEITMVVYNLILALVVYWVIKKGVLLLQDETVENDIKNETET